MKLPLFLVGLKIYFVRILLAIYIYQFNKILYSFSDIICMIMKIYNFNWFILEFKNLTVLAFLRQLRKVLHVAVDPYVTNQCPNCVRSQSGLLTLRCS